MVKGSKPVLASMEGSDAHFVSKGTHGLKLLDRAVADAQVYDDMERNFEKVSSATSLASTLTRFEVQG